MIRLATEIVFTVAIISWACKHICLRGSATLEMISSSCIRAARNPRMWRALIGENSSIKQH